MFQGEKYIMSRIADCLLKLPETIFKFEDIWNVRVRVADRTIEMGDEKGMMDYRGEVFGMDLKSCEIEILERRETRAVEG
jgi:hypothetical protein